MKLSDGSLSITDTQVPCSKGREVVALNRSCCFSADVRRNRNRLAFV